MTVRNLLVLFLLLLAGRACAQKVTGTKPLVGDADIARRMVAGIDRFLLNKIDNAESERENDWGLKELTPDSVRAFLDGKRSRLRQIIGAGDRRVSFTAPETVGTVDYSAQLSSDADYDVIAIRWPVLSDPAPTARNLVSVHGEGLMLQPRTKILGTLVAVPDASQTPEQLAGLADGVPAESQFARRAAACGFRVIIPTIIRRDRSRRNGRADLTDREYLYRPAFELGRHIIGYEVQKILAVVDWVKTEEPDSVVGIAGFGEGGLLSLYAGAIDDRIDGICVSGAFAPFESVWQQPLDRNVFGLVSEFGAAELASMFSGTVLAIEGTLSPDIDLDGNGGAPAKSVYSGREEYSRLCSRLFVLKERLESARGHDITEHHVAPDAFCTSGVVAVLQHLSVESGSEFPEHVWKKSSSNERSETTKNGDFARLEELAAARYRSQFEEIDRHNQALLRESPFVRKEFLKDLNTSSVEAYNESVNRYREIFHNDVIGRFEDDLLPFEALSRKSWETDTWTGHEVVLDVFENVMAYGILLLPKDLKEGEKRPVVVCQHGLEGRPTDTFLNDHRAYHDFAAKLCERGFVVFAPQNPYIFGDSFRTLQRKANLLGKTLFSVIVPQHQQIVNWLKSQPFVDGDRIGFYGLSYGGKSAMRIPALVTDYSLSICSADFNEWVRKNASTRHRFSYVWTGEYEIFEWNLGSTFNYFEMAALICPRPFMVERGHFDGVGTDEWVAYEYAKVRNLYAARLKIPERTEIEWFDGPHTINGAGTFEFLHRHLNWPDEKDAEQN